MADNWWDIWGEVGERSNNTLNTGLQHSIFNLSLPKGKIGTETLDAIGNWFNNTAYGKRFKAGQERQAALEQTLIDQGGPYALYAKIKNQPNQLEQQIFKGISDFTNVDQRITTPATYLALSGGIRGTVKGVRAVAQNPRAMQGLKNINPLAPVSQKVVKVKSTPIHGKPIPAETSASVLKKDSMFRKGSKSEILAKEQSQINRALSGDPTASVFAYTGKGTITEPFVIPKGNTLAARDSRKLLRENYSSWIREEMKKPEIRRPEDIDRRGRMIQTSDGEDLSMQGVKKVWNAIKRGETDAEIAAKTGKNAYITFPASNPESKSTRVKNMQPPVEEARAELIENRPDLAPEQIDEIVKVWSKTSKHGYASTAETARWEGLRYDQRKQELKLKSKGVKKYKTPVSEKTRPQLAAGHGRSVMSRVDHYTKPKGYTGRLYDAPTDQQAVRLEDAIENIKHGNKPEGDINFYAAKKAGWPTTWKEGLYNFVDKYLDENKLPDWRQNLNNAQVEKILKIPSKWGPDKVDVYWEKYIEPLTKHGDIKQSWEIWEDISRRSRRGLPK